MIMAGKIMKQFCLSREKTEKNEGKSKGKKKGGITL